ncbi:HscA protein [Rickettsia prowazekii str. GvF12]|nr:HscA protein [Rickettsia prowazekii str. GvF12]
MRVVPPTKITPSIFGFPDCSKHSCVILIVRSTKGEISCSKVCLLIDIISLLKLSLYVKISFAFLQVVKSQ